MKSISHLLLVLIVLIFFSCNKLTKKNTLQQTDIIVNPNKKAINKTIKKDSLLVFKIFKKDIKTKKTGDTYALFLFNDYYFNINSKKSKNEIILKFKECTFFKDSLKFNERLTHLKTNDWIEETLIIKNDYYEFKEHIIVVDYIKNNLNSCPTLNKKDLIIEQIRIYDRQKYFEIANQSNSILYNLKTITN